MRKISQYILEKLHLNKDIKIISRKYLMFTLFARYREEKYIIPDIIEIEKQEGDEITFKYVTNFLNHKGFDETVTIKPNEDEEKGYEFYSDYIISRNMIFFNEDRAKEIFKEYLDSGENTLIWKKLMDKNTKVTNRHARWPVYALDDVWSEGLRRKQFPGQGNCHDLNKNDIDELLSNF